MTIRSFCKVDIRFVRFRAKNGDHTKDPEILRKWETCGTNNKKNSGYRWIQIDEGGRRWLMVESGCKWLKVDANGCKWIDGNGWKWMKVDLCASLMPFFFLSKKVQEETDKWILI